MSRFDAHTERAIYAAARELPDLVYIGAEMRTKVRVETITDRAPTTEENMTRIMEADPIGFLIAVMNGQPLAVFNVKDDEIVIGHTLPSPELRTLAARYLAMIGSPRRNRSNGVSDFEAMVKRRIKGGTKKTP